MKYEEKFEKYLAGELEEEEKEKIQEDIEKLQVLLGYVADSLDEELLGEEQDGEGQGEAEEDKNDFSREVSKAVSRKFRRYAMGTIAAAVIIVLLLLYGLSPLLNKICYNPNVWEEIYDENEEVAVVYAPFSMTMNLYMELFCGEKGFADVAVRPEGYGRYTLDVQTQISGEITHHSLELVRNHLYQQDMNWNSSELPGNAFRYLDPEGYCGMDKDEIKRKLSDVPEALMLRAAISFDDTKTIAEFKDFMKKYDTHYLYCPIVTTSEKEYGYGGYWGFYPKMAGYVYDGTYDKEKYPYLDIFQYDGRGAGEVPAEVYEQHVESMLRYLMDHEDFLKIFDSSVPGENVADTYKYQAVLDFIQEEGIHTYGTVVFASKEELLNMIEDEDVSGVYIMDSRLNL